MNTCYKVWQKIPQGDGHELKLVADTKNSRKLFENVINQVTRNPSINLCWLPVTSEKNEITMQACHRHS